MYTGIFRESVRVEMLPDIEGGYAMNVLPVALLIFAVVFLAGVFWFGLATLLQISARRQRLQMKRHLQSIERVG